MILDANMKAATLPETILKVFREAAGKKTPVKPDARNWKLS